MFKKLVERLNMLSMVMEDIKKDPNKTSRDKSYNV